MHLDLHPSAGNVSVYTGQVRFGSADFFQTGCVEELTTCTVRTESLRADGPLESVTLDWTLFPNSPARAQVLCLADGGTAEYFVFDPLDPSVRRHLDRVRSSGKLFITAHHSDDVTELPLEAKLFESMPPLGEGNNGTTRAEWLINAAWVVQTLPHTFSFWAPELLQVRDHRAYLMLPS